MKALGFAGTSRGYRGGVVLPPRTDPIPGAQELGGLKEGVTGAHVQGGTSQSRQAEGPRVVPSPVCRGRPGAAGPQQPGDTTRGQLFTLPFLPGSFRSESWQIL